MVERTNSIVFQGFLLAALMLVALRVSALGDGVAPWVGNSFVGIPCSGSEPTNFGPWDYLIQGDMEVVHMAHFSSRVEQLVGGENAAGPTSDLDYVLKVIPNHHRALNSTLQFHYRELRNAYADERRRGLTGFRLKSPVECYLQRAINFRSHDAVSRMLYATLLQRTDMKKEAAYHYEKALLDKPNSANIQYNYALLLVEMGELDKAEEMAHDLYGNNFPLPGLKKKLISAGHWSQD